MLDSISKKSRSLQRAKTGNLLLSLVLLLPFGLRSQIYTYDFLTYVHDGQPSDFAHNKWRIDLFLYRGANEFDESGRPRWEEDEIYGVWYIYLSYRLYNTTSVNVNLALQTGWFFSEPPGFGIFVGTPLLWANFRLPIRLPLWLRIGLDLGKVGIPIGIEDNEFDICLSSSKNIGLLTLLLSASYRIRGRADKEYALPWVDVIPIGESTGLYDQAGNEIHFKMQASNKMYHAIQLSFFVMGYYGGNKKYNGRVISNSHSYKTALGTSVAFRTRRGRILTVRFLWDFYGRSVAKGSAIVFEFAK